MLKLELNIRDIFAITVYGFIGFFMTIYELISNLIDHIFGEEVWVLTTKIGKPTFKFKEIEKDTSYIERYLQFHSKRIKKLRRKRIYENSFSKEHSSYFKLVYKWKRIKNP